MDLKKHRLVKLARPRFSFNGIEHDSAHRPCLDIQTPRLHDVGDRTSGSPADHRTMPIKLDRPSYSTHPSQLFVFSMIMVVRT